MQLSGIGEYRQFEMDSTDMEVLPDRSIHGRWRATQPVCTMYVLWSSISDLWQTVAIPEEQIQLAAISIVMIIRPHSFSWEEQAVLRYFDADETEKTEER